MNQLSFLEEPPRARATDPSTSHDAASRAKALQADHHCLILGALGKYGPLGKDAIAARTRLDGVQVCRRLVELQRKGAIAPTGKTVQSTAGRPEREWRLS